MNFIVYTLVRWTMKIDDVIANDFDARMEISDLVVVFGKPMSDRNHVHRPSYLYA